MKTTRFLCLAILLTSLTGCASMQYEFNDCTSQIHNRCLARQAWLEWFWCYSDQAHPHDFGKGFRAGYVDIVEGGTGCQPTVPPACYWNSHYRNATGQSKINAWYEGFSHGALAAMQDGYASAMRIPVSPTCRTNWAQAQARREAEAARRRRPRRRRAPDAPPESQQIDTPEEPPADDDELNLEDLMDGTDDVAPGGSGPVRPYDDPPMPDVPEVDELDKAAQLLDRARAY